MFYIHSFLNLYQLDDRRGDELLTPQRYYNHIWSTLTTRSLDPHRSTVWQVAERVAKMTLLIFPTLLAYAVGLIGVAIKAYSPHPIPIRHNHLPSFLQTVDPNFVRPSDPQHMHALAVSNQQISRLQPQKHLEFTVIVPRDIALFSFTYLGSGDLFNAMTVSKQFKKLLQSSVLWNEYLTHDDLHIWGGRPNLFIRIANSYGFQYADEVGELDHLSQLKAYYSLRRQGLSGPHNQFYDYLARLMIGGPLAFSQIPDLGQIDPKTLEPHLMPQAIVRGKTWDRQDFLALRIIDREQENGSPIVLLFIRQSNFEWNQPANRYWAHNQLNLTNQNVLNYILAIVSKNYSLDNYQFPGSKLRIELA